MEKLQKEHDQEKLEVSEEEMPPLNAGPDDLSYRLVQLRFSLAQQRKKIVSKLNDYPGTRTAAALINVLINDDSETVRKEAAQILDNFNDKMALPFLKWTKQL